MILAAIRVFSKTECLSFRKIYLRPGFCIILSHSGLFFEHQYKRKRSYTRAYTHSYEHRRTPYPYEYLRKTEPAYHLEIYEITVGTSSSTGTSPPTEYTSTEILE